MSGLVGNVSKCGLGLAAEAYGFHGKVLRLHVAVSKFFKAERRVGVGIVRVAAATQRRH